MPSPRDAITQDAWSKQAGMTNVSLEEFNEQTRNLLACFVEAQASLQRVYVPFKKSESIRPMQCRAALNVLVKVDKRVKQFCSWLDDIGQLAPAMISLPWQFMVALHKIEEQAYRLINLTRDFRTACIRPVQKTTEQQQEISHSFEALMEFVEDLFLGAEYLHDDIHFQQRSFGSRRNKPRSLRAQRAIEKVPAGRKVIYLCDKRQPAG